MPGPSSGCVKMSGASIKMEKSEESMGGGGAKGWGGGGAGRDRDSSSDGGGGSGAGGGGGSGENTGLDPQLWHACAGGMVQLPPVGAKVIYFPQGHGEQAATPPEFPRVMGTGSTGTIPCRVMSVNFLADTETDEVYARMRLQTLPQDPSAQSSHSDSSVDATDAAGPASPPPEKTNSFAKTLTQSDANNGGGFSVPRYCAETIFPPLDYSIDPPVQTIVAKDVHGEKWRFRHIYRGTPRRHLLTTGWSTFVNQKKLVAGDAIVFLRSASGELCVGVRRSMRGTGGSDSSNWSGGGPSTSHHRPSRWEVKGSDVYSDFFTGDSAAGSSSASSSGASGAATRGQGGLGTGPGIGMSGPSTSSSFARNRARVTAQSVLDAASLALSGQPFEVVYYPRASTAEFCVKEQSVKAALEQHWFPGMRFKMAFETEDSSRISWFMGTINLVQPCDPLWPKSPWRILQVNWDEPDLLQGVSRVSPWQVELVSALPIQFPAFASMPKKRLRASQPAELNLPGQGLMGMPMATMPPVFGQTDHHPNNSWPHRVIVEDVSAGMQGARHERVFGLALTEPFRPSKMQAGGFFSSDAYYHPDPPERNSSGSQLAAFSPMSNANASSYPPFQGRGQNPPSSSNSMVGSKNPRGNFPQEDHQHGPSWAAAAGVTTTSSSNHNKSPTMPSSTPLVLFGQAINPDSNLSHGQQSGGNTSDGISSLQRLKEEFPGKGQDHLPPSYMAQKDALPPWASRIETPDRFPQKYFSYIPPSAYNPQGKSSQDDHQHGPSWAAGGVTTTSTSNSKSSTPSSTSLTLFGQAINSDSNLGRVQHSGGSSFDGRSSFQHQKEEESSGKGHELLPLSLLVHTETPPPTSVSRIEPADRFSQKYFIPPPPLSSGYHPNGKIHSLGGTVVAGTDASPPWASGGGGWMTLEKDRRTGVGDRPGPAPPPQPHQQHLQHHPSSVGRESSHCKVFRESDEVGRTVDLGRFSSYDELYENLGTMFGMDKKPLVNAMVYRDAGSRTKEVGYEPYGHRPALSYGCVRGPELQVGEVGTRSASAATPSSVRRCSD